MRNRLFVRRFLNAAPHGAGAFVFASIADTTGAEGSYVWRDVRLEIADCSRRISLDFPLDTSSSRRNSLAKARLLTSVLSRFTDALGQEAELAAERGRIRAAVEDARRGTTRGKAAWMVHVETVGSLPGLDEQALDRLLDELMPFSAALVGGTGGPVGAMMTAWASCREDAPAIASETFRVALCAAGITWTGEIRAEVDQGGEGE